MLRHVIYGTGVAAVSYFLLLQYFRPFLADLSTRLLSLVQITFEKNLSMETPSLALRMLDGSDLNIVLTWQRSGLFCIIIFGLFFFTLAFSLEGPFWLKVVWLEVGSLVGLAWSLIRLLALMLIAYQFGPGTFTATDFITNPVLDFLWVIPVWSLGLAGAVSARRKRLQTKEVNPE